MNKLVIILLSFVLISNTYAQEVQLELNIDQVIKLAREQSYDALIAKHTFRGSYWQYRTHIANLRPNISLNSDLLNYQKYIDKYTDDQGSQFYQSNQNTSDLSLSLNQAVPLTGGNIYFSSNLDRIDKFYTDSSTYSYSTAPVSIGYRQPLFSFNSLKWEKKIEPIKYDEAKKEYIERLEQVSIRAINYFFDLALAQINMDIANINYNNNDTLYKIARGRFNIGTIAKNELLQMELNFLSSKAELEQAKLNLEIKEFQLQSFLGYNEKVNIVLIIPRNTPEADIKFEEAINLALQNNPEILSYERQLIEAQRQVAQAKSQNRFQADLYSSYGLTNQGDEVNEVFNDMNNSLMINVGISVPILDWGKGSGLVKIAKSNQEVINASITQQRIQFEQNIYLKVREFNIQQDQFEIAAQADTIAQSKYDVTKQRFLIGKIDVLELNIALTEKDSKRRAYISALRNYWNNYFTIRQLTQYDFIKRQALQADYEQLVE